MKSSILKNLSNASAILISAVLLNGCNTVEGMGEDIQAGGHAIHKAVSGDEDHGDKSYSKKQYESKKTKTTNGTTTTQTTTKETTKKATPDTTQETTTNQTTRTTY